MVYNLRMKGISDFLAKFKIIPDPKDEKKIIVEIINNIIGHSLNEEIVEVRGSSISLHIHPALKSLIFQHKNNILDALNVRFNGEKEFNNIN